MMKYIVFAATLLCIEPTFGSMPSDLPPSAPTVAGLGSSAGSSSGVLIPAPTSSSSSSILLSLATATSISPSVLTAEAAYKMGLGFLVSDNATEHLVGDEERKAELFLTKSATAGFVDAQCSLGKMLANEGRGSAKRFTGSSKPLRRIMEVLNIS